MSNLSVDYDINDFLYYKYAYDASTKKEMYSCSDDTINPTSTLGTTCDKFPDLKTPSGKSGQPGPCSEKFTKNICDNKRYADALLIQTTNHSGADELYQNTTSHYNFERISTINLGIGIILGCVFIAKYK